MTTTHVTFGALALVLLAAWSWRSNAAASGRPDAVGVKPLYEQGAVFLDVRTASEWNGGHLRRAVHLPLDELDRRVGEVLPDRSAPIVVYCRSGRRSQVAASTLRSLGYSEVIPMRGGLSDLAGAGYPIVR